MIAFAAALPPLLLLAATAGPTGTVAGTVTDAYGKPVAAAVIAVNLDAETVRGRAGDDGTFSLPGVRVGRTTLHAKTADGRRGWGFVMNSGGVPFAASDEKTDAAAGTKIAVGPAGSVRLAVTGTDGSPAAGARAVSIVTDGVGPPAAGGELYLTAAMAEAVALGWEPAGADGIIKLHGLPAGAAVKVVLAHPAAAHATTDPLPVVSGGGDPHRVRLPAGGEVRLTLSPASGGPPLPLTGYEMRARGGGPRGTLIFDEPWEATRVPGGGTTLSVRLEAGEGFLFVTHPELASIPRSITGIEISAGETQNLAATALRRAVATGRVAVPAGGDESPIGSVYAYTRVPGAEDDGIGEGWAFTGITHDFAADGAFAVPAGVGEVRLLARTNPIHGRWFPTATNPFVLSADGAKVGTVAVTPLPSVTGTVTNPDGSPAAGALVVVGVDLHNLMYTARTDAAGRFGFEPHAAAGDVSTGFHYKLEAFHPTAPHAATVRVPLAPGETPEHVSIALEPTPFPPPPTPLENWRERAGEEAADAGDAAPPVTASVGFAATGEPAEPVTLDSLRGRWVLLDLRTTWCAPCRLAEPTLHALAAAYADRLTVLEAYDTSDTPAAIAGYLAERPAAGPVVRDAESGATFTAYRVRGFPTRVLIDLAGRIRLTDRQNGDALRGDLAATVRAFLAADASPPAADDRRVPRSRPPAP